MSNVVEIRSAEEFDALRADNNVVLKFWATWCGPCRQFAPHFDSAAEIASEDPEVYASVDVDVVPELAARYGVQGIPTVLAFTSDDVVASVKQRRTLPLVAEINALLDKE